MSAATRLRVELGRLVDDPPTNPDRLASVRRRAGGMRRRRAAAATTGMAVASALALLVTSTVIAESHAELTRLPTTSRLSPSLLPTRILLADQQGRVHLLDRLTATRAKPVAGPVIQTGSSLRAAVGTGADGRTIIAMDAVGDIVAIDPDHPASPRVLLAVTQGAGQPVGYDVPGVGRRTMVRPYLSRGGGLWLWVAQQSDQLPVRGSSLVPLDLSGRLAGPPVDLPPIQWVVAVGRLGAYVSVSAGDDRLRLMRVDADGRLHRVSAEGAPALDEGNYGAALWNGSTTCDVGATAGGSTDDCHHEALDAETGAITTLKGRPSVGYLAEDVESFSPDGRYAAVSYGGLPLAKDGSTLQGWAVVNLATGAVTVVRSTIHVAPSVPADTVVWSGDRLLWTSAAPDGRSTIVGAFVPATGQFVATTLPVKGLRALGAAA
jgi:hypothetical protein